MCQFMSFISKYPTLFDRRICVQTGQDFTLKDILMVKQVLMNLEEFIDSIPITRTEGVTKPGEYVKTYSMCLIKMLHNTTYNSFRSMF